jgi:hypothetical protein
MKTNLYLFLAIFLFSVGCSENKSEKIIGYWKLDKIATNQKIENQEEYRKSMLQLIKTTSIQFNADGSFGGTIWQDTSFGSWSIKNDTLFITDLSNKNKFFVIISDLTSSKLVLQEQKDSLIEVLTFVR